MCRARDEVSEWEGERRLTLDGVFFLEFIYELK